MRPKIKRVGAVVRRGVSREMQRPVRACARPLARRRFAGHQWNMAKIRLIRDDAPDASDERDPYLVTISRVPSAGEFIHAAETTSGRVARRPAFYRVTRVVHYAGFPDEVDARVHVEEVSE